MDMIVNIQVANESEAKAIRKNKESVVEIVKDAQAKIKEMLPKDADILHRALDVNLDSVNNDDLYTLYKKLFDYLLNNSEYVDDDDDPETLLCKYLQNEFRLHCLYRTDHLDWASKDQPKYYMSYDAKSDEVSIGGPVYQTKREGTNYVSDPKIFREFIDKIGEENFKKYILEIEE